MSPAGDQGSPSPSQLRRGTTTAPHDERRRAWPWLAWGAIVAGTLLRLEVARKDLSLWHDEAMLALNILGRGWAEQFQPLWYEQAAPPLYLLLVRLTALSTGGSEFWLRFPALVAGVGLLMLVWQVGQRVVGAEAAAWATWVVALSAPLVHYANEVKPYQTDALVTVALIGLAASVLAGAPARPRLAAFGAVAVLLSLPSVFILAAVAAILGVDGLLRREWRLVASAAGLALLWSMVFLSAYLLMHQGTAQSEFMQTFWSDRFLRPGAGFLGRAANALAAVTEPLPVPGRFREVGYLVVGVAIAVAVLIRTIAWPLVALLTGPFAVAGMASLLGMYPFGARTVLFLAPLSALIAAKAVVTLLQAVGAHRIGARTVVAGLLLLPTAVRYQASGPSPIGSPRNEREVLTFLARTPASDLVLLTPRAVPLWLYYTEDWRRPDRERINWHADRFQPIGDSNVPRFTAARESQVSVEGLRHGRVEIASTGNGLGIRTDGRAYDVPFQDWGPRVRDELAAMGVSRVWVYTARETDLEALAAAWEQGGGLVVRHEPFQARRILELSQPGQP